MSLELRFQKSGKEIKSAVRGRLTSLKERLDARNTSLGEFMLDSKLMRSYLVRSTQQDFFGGHGRASPTLFGPDDISSERKQEIFQLCRRIYEIEQEIHRLSLLLSHLSDDQIFELPFEDLVAYGFESKIQSE